MQRSQGVRPSLLELVRDPVCRSGGGEGQGIVADMSEIPNYERVADVLIRVVLRLVGKDDGPKGGGLGADTGILPGLNRGTGDRRLLDRRPGGQTPGLLGCT